MADLESALHIKNLLDIMEEHKQEIESAEVPLMEGEDRVCVSVQYCSVHAGKELELYCETCLELICLKCAVKSGMHYGHDYDELDEAFEKCKKDIASSMKSIEEKLVEVSEVLTSLDRHCDDISEQEAAVEGDIDRTTAQLHELIDTRRVKLIDELHKLAQSKKDKVKSQKDQVEVTYADLSSYLDFVRETLATKSDMEMLMMKMAIIMQVQELPTPNHGALKLVTETDLKFFASSEVNSACEEYGEILAEQRVRSKKSPSYRKGLSPAHSWSTPARATCKSSFLKVNPLVADAKELLSPVRHSKSISKPKEAEATSIPMPSTPMSMSDQLDSKFGDILYEEPQEAEPKMGDSLGTSFGLKLEIEENDMPRPIAELVPYEVDNCAVGEEEIVGEVESEEGEIAVDIPCNEEDITMVPEEEYEVYGDRPTDNSFAQQQVLAVGEEEIVGEVESEEGEIAVDIPCNEEDITMVPEEEYEVYGDRPTDNSFAQQQVLAVGEEEIVGEGESEEGEIAVDIPCNEEDITMVPEEEYEVYGDRPTDNSFAQQRVLAVGEEEIVGEVESEEGVDIPCNEEDITMVPEEEYEVFGDRPTDNSFAQQRVLAVGEEEIVGEGESEEGEIAVDIPCNEEDITMVPEEEYEVYGDRPTDNSFAQQQVLAVGEEEIVGEGESEEGEIAVDIPCNEEDITMVPEEEYEVYGDRPTDNSFAQQQVLAVGEEEIVIEGESEEGEIAVDIPCNEEDIIMVPEEEYEVYGDRPTDNSFAQQQVLAVGEEEIVGEGESEEGEIAVDIPCNEEDITMVPEEEYEVFGDRPTDNSFAQQRVLAVGEEEIVGEVESEEGEIAVDIPCNEEDITMVPEEEYEVYGDRPTDNSFAQQRVLAVGEEEIVGEVESEEGVDIPCNEEDITMVPEEEYEVFGDRPTDNSFAQQRVLAVGEEEIVGEGESEEGEIAVDIPCNEEDITMVPEEEYEVYGDRPTDNSFAQQQVLAVGEEEIVGEGESEEGEIAVDIPCNEEDITMVPEEEYEVYGDRPTDNSFAQQQVLAVGEEEIVIEGESEEGEIAVDIPCNEEDIIMVPEEEYEVYGDRPTDNSFAQQQVLAVGEEEIVGEGESEEGEIAVDIPCNEEDITMVPEEEYEVYGDRPTDNSFAQQQVLAVGEEEIVGEGESEEGEIAVDIPCNEEDITMVPEEEYEVYGDRPTDNSFAQQQVLAVGEEEIVGEVESEEGEIAVDIPCNEEDITMVPEEEYEVYGDRPTDNSFAQQRVLAVGEEEIVGEVESEEGEIAVDIPCNEEDITMVPEEEYEVFGDRPTDNSFAQQRVLAVGEEEIVGEGESEEGEIAVDIPCNEEDITMVPEEEYEVYGDRPTDNSFAQQQVLAVGEEEIVGEGESEEGEIAVDIPCNEEDITMVPEEEYEVYGDRPTDNSFAQQQVLAVGEEEIVGEGESEEGEIAVDIPCNEEDITMVPEEEYEVYGDRPTDNSFAQQQVLAVGEEEIVGEGESEEGEIAVDIPCNEEDITMVPEEEYEVFGDRPTDNSFAQQRVLAVGEEEIVGEVESEEGEIAVDIPCNEEDITMVPEEEYEVFGDRPTDNSFAQQRVLAVGEEEIVGEGESEEGEIAVDIPCNEEDITMVPEEEYEVYGDRPTDNSFAQQQVLAVGEEEIVGEGESEEGEIAVDIPCNEEDITMVPEEEYEVYGDRPTDNSFAQQQVLAVGEEEIVGEGESEEGEIAVDIPCNEEDITMVPEEEYEVYGDRPTDNSFAQQQVLAVGEEEIVGEGESEEGEIAVDIPCNEEDITMVPEEEYEVFGDRPTDNSFAQQRVLAVGEEEIVGEVESEEGEIAVDIPCNEEDITMVPEEEYEVYGDRPTDNSFAQQQVLAVGEEEIVGEVESEEGEIAVDIPCNEEDITMVPEEEYEVFGDRPTDNSFAQQRVLAVGEEEIVGEVESEEGEIAVDIPCNEEDITMVPEEEYEVYGDRPTDNSFAQQQVLAVGEEEIVIEGESEEGEIAVDIPCNEEDITMVPEEEYEVYDDRPTDNSFAQQPHDRVLAVDMPCKEGDFTMTPEEEYEVYGDCPIADNSFAQQPHDRVLPW